MVLSAKEFALYPTIPLFCGMVGKEPTFVNGLLIDCLALETDSAEIEHEI